jgi:cytidylate kinase
VPGYRSIVISGPPSSGKTPLVNALASEHNLKKFSVGDTLRKEHAAECPNNELTFDVWWRGLTLDQNRQIALSTIPVFNKGGIVGDSRYTFFLDKEINLLVFLNAEIDIRARRAMANPRYKGMKMSEIKTMLRQREEDEASVGMKLFGKDYRDPSNYHLTLNTGLLTEREEVSIISAVLGDLRY